MQDWQDKLEFMRKNGVDEARWDNNCLIYAKLGPERVKDSVDEAPAPMTDAQERTRRILGASSRLVAREG